MCGTCNGTTNGTAEPAATGSVANGAEPAAAGSIANGAEPAEAVSIANGTASNGTTTANGNHQAQSKSSPYQSVKDYLSNVDKYKIIESTLREGEQFANAFFDLETKIKMYDRRPTSQIRTTLWLLTLTPSCSAKALDSFGVDYIELTNPCSSPQSFEDCKTIAGLGLKVSVASRPVEGTPKLCISCDIFPC
jgi:homocitrate synthase